MPSPAGHADLLPPPLLDADRIALFLDMDGVLAPIMARPEAVTADARRTAVLRFLAVRLKGRLAILSGRTLSEIDRITDGAVASAAGVHGLERRQDGAVRSTLADPALGEAVAAFRDFARSRPGAQVEDKGLSTALHYRLAPDHAHAALDLARDLAAATGLRLQGGDMVVELRTPGADKGSALAWVAETRGVPRADVMAIGDSGNDVGMVSWAGVGCAPADAKPDVLAVARHVSALPHDSGAVADLLERLALPPPRP